MVSDPEEQHDLSEERPEVVRNLFWRLRSWRRGCEPLEGLDWTPPTLSQEETESLKAVGYLE